MRYRWWSPRNPAPVQREHRLRPRQLAELLLWLNPRPVGQLIYSSDAGLRRRVARW